MAEEKHQEVVGAPLWGIILLFLGIVLLLQTFDVLPWGLWGTLWRFWPALIIIVGLRIVLHRCNAWLVSLLLLAILGACLGLAIWQHGIPASPGTTAQVHSKPLDNLERVQVEADFSATSIALGSLPSGSANLVEVESRVKNAGEGMRVDLQKDDNEGKLYLSTEPLDQRFRGKEGARWEVNFTRKIPLSFSIKSAASNMELDLGELEVTELRLDLDAGNCKVTMPSSAGVTYAYIKADVANLEIEIPDKVAAKIRADMDLSALEIDESRFPREGDYYISRDFESAENKLELQIDCDVGRVEVK